MKYYYSDRAVRVAPFVVMSIMLVLGFSSCTATPDTQRYTGETYSLMGDFAPNDCIFCKSPMIKISVKDNKYVYACGTYIQDNVWHISKACKKNATAMKKGE